MPIARILIVEDEEAIQEMLAVALEQASFTVDTALDARRGQELLEENPPDLLLLDWMLPGVSGVEWARRLRKDDRYHDIPIILLTARGEEEDKVRGLESGADDYLTKPFSPRELVARIKAVLRRSGRGAESSRVEIGGILLDMDEHRIAVAGQPIFLSPTEYRLLEFFLTHPGKVFSRGQLLDQVWGRSTYIEERTVDVHIRRLRKILAEYEREELIQTVRGFGYRFSENVA